MPAKTKAGRSAAAVKAAKTRRYKSTGRKAALTKKRAAPTPLAIVKKGYNGFVTLLNEERKKGCVP